VKLLLDEHFSPEVARQLRDRGHDVTTAREAAVHAVSDRDLLAVAIVERRAVVTENVADFVELHRAATITGSTHYGLVFTSPRQFPRTRRAIGRLVRALEVLLRAHPSIDALRDQTWWLEPPR
jgi:predicted nuclease of predicted toxin-antitoxin system